MPSDYRVARNGPQDQRRPDLDRKAPEQQRDKQSSHRASSQYGLGPKSCLGLLKQFTGIRTRKLGAKPRAIFGKAEVSPVNLHKDEEATTHPSPGVNAFPYVCL